MATITTSQFLDDAARTAGETMTVSNGAILTIRTDTRWHANAPASMTGSIGSYTSSASGGGYVIDARNVRWLAYDTGTGNVPAIGTTITQGGVSGYLLGVWSALNAAPTAVGAAMPATGFIKFREVTGGNYAAGALTGIGANATGADVAGWIEVVADVSATMTTQYIDTFNTYGDWFYLDNTTGSVGQIIQTPTNGGGGRVPGVFIETGVGTNEYEFYAAISTGRGFTTANLGTDIRSRFVENMTDGRVRIGSDGTNNIGYVPPAGCKVRIPNILLKQCATGTRATNADPNATLTTRPETSTAGVVSFDYVYGDWYFNFSTSKQITVSNSALFDQLNFVNVLGSITLTNAHAGIWNGNTVGFQFNSCTGGIIMTDCTSFRETATGGGHPVSFTYCDNIDVDGLRVGVVQFARSSAAFFLFQNSNNITTTNTQATNTNLQFQTCNNVTASNHDHVDRFVGSTNTTTGLNAVGANLGCLDVTIENVTNGFNNTITNVHPYTSMVAFAATTNAVAKNIGTYASPVSGGSANILQYAVRDAGNCVNIAFKRIYVSAVATEPFQSANSSVGVTIQNLYAFTGGTQRLAAQNLTAQSIFVAGGHNNTTVNGALGSHYMSYFTSTTAGVTLFQANDVSSVTSPYITLLGNGKMLGTGNIYLPAINDGIIFEHPDFIKGFTAFTNSALTAQGNNTTNYTYEYDIDTGSGFSGTYKSATGANYSAETINAVDGFKLRLRVICVSANANNTLNNVRFPMTTTASAQQELYPLEYPTISLNGYTVGSRIQIYDVTNSQELYNAVPAGSSVSVSYPYNGDITARIRVMYVSGATAKNFLEFSTTVGTAGFSTTIIQEDDTVYIGNAIDGSTVTGITIDDTNLLVEVDTGQISWQEIYAYETYWLGTQQGIRDEGRFIEAVDQANYIIYDFKIKNISSPSTPLEITGGYGVDSVTGKSIDLVDNTGGTIFNAPDHVVAFGVDPIDTWTVDISSVTTAGTAGRQLNKAKSNSDLISALL